jgi:hypothetical protein
MIKRALVAIAGVDRATLATCPATDRVWAAHLGFSLCLSFVVVLGISFHATGYVIADPWMRGGVSSVIALTVFMFDRALYQSDWFYQGFLWLSGSAADGGAGGGKSARRFLRITIRLGMSFGLAWVIAVFLELAIFSDTITDKIKRDHVAANQPVFQKIEQFQAGLAAEIEQRRKSLAALETVYRDELAKAPAAEIAEPAQFGEFEQQIQALDAQENELRAELRLIQEQIKGYAADMNAEQLGQRVSAGSSGRAGAGPRYQFAKQQKEVYEAQAATRESEIAQLRVKRDDLRAAQGRLAADVTARRDQARTAVQGKRDAVQAQVEAARNSLKELEASLLLRIDDFRQKALAASDFQKQKDDPLSRMTAYQELKSDPKDGDTITLFSWMTKFLIIFLEIVPVVAKLFFSPPSVYAARIQADVERERRRIRRELDLSVAPESEIEERMAEIGATIRREAPPPRHREPEFIAEAIEQPNAKRIIPTEDESGPSLVPLMHEKRVREKPPEASALRTAPARKLEAERQKEMERLIHEEMLKQAAFVSVPLVQVVDVQTTGQGIAGETLQAGERRAPSSSGPQSVGDAQAAPQPALESSNTLGLLPPADAGIQPEDVTVAKVATSTTSSVPDAVPASSIALGAAVVPQLKASAGITPPPNIVLGDGAASQPTSNTVRSDDLGGSAGAAASRPVAAAQADTSAAERPSSRPSNPASEPPSMNFDNRIDALDRLASGSSAGSQDWLNDFLNHLGQSETQRNPIGQSETQRNPNAGIRVRPTLRAADRRPVEPAPRREGKELTPSSFLLQDDIPQKP